jgi:hypothetical protein
METVCSSTGKAKPAAKKAPAKKAPAKKAASKATKVVKKSSARRTPRR